MTTFNKMNKHSHAFTLVMVVSLKKEKVWEENQIQVEVGWVVIVCTALTNGIEDFNESGHFRFTSRHQDFLCSMKSDNGP